MLGLPCLKVSVEVVVILRVWSEEDFSRFGLADLEIFIVDVDDSIFFTFEEIVSVFLRRVHVRISFCHLNVGRRTSNVERRTSNVERRPKHVERFWIISALLTLSVVVSGFVEVRFSLLLQTFQVFEKSDLRISFVWSQHFSRAVFKGFGWLRFGRTEDKRKENVIEATWLKFTLINFEC